MEYVPRVVKYALAPPSGYSISGCMSKAAWPPIVCPADSIDPWPPFADLRISISFSSDIVGALETGGRVSEEAERVLVRGWDGCVAMECPIGVSGVELGRDENCRGLLQSTGTGVTNGSQVRSLMNFTETNVIAFWGSSVMPRRRTSLFDLPQLCRSPRHDFGGRTALKQQSRDARPSPL